MLTLICAVAAEPAGGFTQQEIEKAYRDIVPATCLVTYSSEITNPSTGETSKREASSLGLIVSPSGLAIAPGHMQLENSEPSNISVAVGGGDKEQRYSATLLKKPEDINVCFLKLQSPSELKLPYVKFTPGAPLKLGEPVLLVGILSETLDFTRGAFTARIGAIIEKPRTTYCLDGAIRFGFVSSPVINIAGQVVGVVGFDLTPNEGGDIYVRSGHPLIYQADLFQKYIEHPQAETEAKNSAEEAWLGIFTQPLSDDYADYWGLPREGGLIVSSVMPGSPAEAAGLKMGDIICGFNGNPVRAKQDREVIGFTKMVRDTGIGKTVTLKLVRNEKPMELEVTLAARPKPAKDAGEFKDDALGMTVREITTDMRIMLNVSEDVKGVIVRRVKSGSAADLAGIRPGIIIMGLGKLPIASLDDYKKAVAKIVEVKPKEVSAFCRAGGASGFFRLEPRWQAAPAKE
jgi:serine protease Do